ncbi:MAG: 3-keto-disaccharide hydrolase [Bryobacteraceae bacterium]
MYKLAFAVLLAAMCARAAGWVNLVTKSLDAWEAVGDGLWHVMQDGTLVGQRELRKAQHQAWLYTKADFGEFDLHLEYWLRHGGNSGVSIRDATRAKFAVAANWDEKRTPAHNGYEIQIGSGGGGKFPSGSVYLFDSAKPGVQREGEWNSMDVEVRNDMIRVKLNGTPVSQHAGDPARPKTGPIGLQLHDPQSFIMYRNIRVRRVGK